MLDLGVGMAVKDWLSGEEMDGKAVLLPLREPRVRPFLFRFLGSSGAVFSFAGCLLASVFSRGAVGYGDRG
jgi:hypothetical protein